jgi:predicted membrane protein (TIGR00267 family)
MKEKSMLHHENQDSSFRSKAFQSMREIVFGLEDGIVSTLGALTGIAAGVQDFSIIVLAGFVIIFVESLSMAAGTYLSSKSEQEMEEKILDEEREEIQDDPEGERQELVDFYTERGFTAEETDMIVRRVTADKDLWLEEMAHKELGIILDKERTPVRDALFMGVSYIVGGCVPLVLYFFIDLPFAIVASVTLSIGMLFIIGFVKGKLVGVHSIKSGLEMMLVSLTAAGIGYAVSQIVGQVLPL